MSDLVATRPAAPNAQAIRLELRALLRLATPIVAAFVGNQLLSAVDTAVVGRLGEVPLGAVGMGGGLYFAVAVLGLGLMLGTDPLISQAVGAGHRGAARRTLWQGFWMAGAMTLPLALGIWGVARGLEPMGIDAYTARETTGYLVARLPGLLPFLVFVGARSYLQGHDITMPMVVGVVIANLVNLPLSWALVFGDAGLEPYGVPALGIPALGAAGAGWASTVSTLIQCLVALSAIRRVTLPTGTIIRRPDRALLRRILHLGLPVGITLLVEVGLFAVVAVLMGLLGTRPLAAHNIALTLIAMTFQVPLGIGIAASVRVGQAVGRGDGPGTRLAGIVALLVAGAFMLLMSLLLALLPGSLGRILSNQPGVLAAAVPLVMIAAVFQLADGMQVVAAGALRGAGDTRVALLANLGGHYAIGLPLGVGLTWGLGWGAAGLWWGLSAGLFAVAVVLTARFLRLTRNAIARS